LLAHSGLKGLTDERVGGAGLVPRELQIADHADRIVNRRLVGLGASNIFVPLRLLSRASRGIGAPLFVGEP
jgi:hypothetical protein